MIPDVGGDGVEGVVSDDAVVGTTTLEGLEEIRMGGGSGIDDGRVGQDDFELLDIVTGKAIFGGEEGDSNWYLLEKNNMMMIYKKDSPPRIKPPTPTSPERPPTAARPYSSNRL